MPDDNDAQVWANEDLTLTHRMRQPGKVILYFTYPGEEEEQFLAVLASRDEVRVVLPSAPVPADCGEYPTVTLYLGARQVKRSGYWPDLWEE